MLLVLLLDYLISQPVDKIITHWGRVEMKSSIPFFRSMVKGIRVSSDKIALHRLITERCMSVNFEVVERGT